MGEEISKEDPRLSPPWYGSDLWTEQGIRFLDEAIEAEKPLFWYLAHVAPHFPCMAPEETIAKYRGKYRIGWDKLAKERHDRQLSSGLIQENWVPHARPKAIPAWDSLPEEKQVRYDDMMAIYAAMLEEVDKNIGKLVEALKERGQLENTLILFLSDNGGNAEAGVAGRYEGDRPGDPHSNVFIGQCWAHLNNVPFRKYKHYNHEGGIATPLIAHWPAGISEGKGRWEHTPAHVIDLMATCVDLAGAKYPTEFRGNQIYPMSGVSLRPLFSGKALAGRPLFWEHEGNAAVRMGDEKLVRLGEKGQWELYNLADDRTEQNNLASARSQRVGELAEKWEQWARKNNVLPKPAKKKRAKKKKAGK